ncbi:MAG: amidohydrolase family protein [Oscillospiraceae bacterium]|nr:amidohydrolase family protein [Oscillospiraceae bacterium]
MSQIVYDEAYERDLAKYFDENLPEKIYDAHFHISRAYTERCGYPGTPFEQYSQFMQKYICRPMSGGMVMPQPSRLHTPETLADENQYNLALAKEKGLAAGLIVTPGCGREATEKMLDTHEHIKVLKPYHAYCPMDMNRYESDILDYAPEWMWQLANDREFPILIHLSHYQNMLNDENNWGQIRMLCAKYPRVKLILAHCAMGHNVRKLRLGLEHIKDIENIWFDCSGAAETMSIYYCLKAFGAERMMYGGDYDHGESVGRICSFGSNFIGFHEPYINKEAIPPDYKYQPLNNAQECTMAALEAIEVLGLSKTDVENIFYNNAAKLFA